MREEEERARDEEDEGNEDEEEKEEDDRPDIFPHACPPAPPATVMAVVIVIGVARLEVGFGLGMRVETQGVVGRHARTAPAGTAARPGMQMPDLLPSVPEASVAPSFLHSHPPLLPPFPSAPSSLSAPSPVLL